MNSNEVLRLIENWWASRYSERHGIVTSYDPKKYLAKVTFQPEGQESGWLPIETGHIGQGYGVTMGLQPGGGAQQGGTGSGGDSGGGSGSGTGDQSQNQGDQVIVRYQEGDFESGKIVQRVHSDMDTPPETQSGEMIFWAKFQQSGGGMPDSADGGQGGTGQQIFFKKDGSLTFTDGNGGTLVFDGKGNCTLNCKDLTMQADGNRKITIKGSDTVEIGGSLSKKISGTRTDKVSGSWMATAASGVWAWLTAKNLVGGGVA